MADTSKLSSWLQTGYCYLEIVRFMYRQFRINQTCHQLGLDPKVSVCLRILESFLFLLVVQTLLFIPHHYILQCQDLTALWYHPQKKDYRPQCPYNTTLCSFLLQLLHDPLKQHPNRSSSNHNLIITHQSIYYIEQSPNSSMIRASIHSTSQLKLHRNSNLQPSNSQSNKQIYYNQNIIPHPLAGRPPRPQKKSNSKNSKTQTKSNCSKIHRQVSHSSKQKNIANSSRSRSKMGSGAKKQRSGKSGKCEQRKKSERKPSKAKGGSGIPKSKLTLSQKELQKARNIGEFESEYVSIETKPKPSRSRRADTWVAKEWGNETRNEEAQKIEIPAEPLGMRSPLPIFCRISGQKQPYFAQIQQVGSGW